MLALGGSALYIRPLSARAFMDDTRLKKLKFRAWHRGFREADLILGPFADKLAQNPEPEQVETLERLLEENDHDIYGWVAGRADPPADYADLIAALRDMPGQPRGA